jgi:hypothetical protein
MTKRRRAAALRTRDQETDFGKIGRHSKVKSQRWSQRFVERQSECEYARVTGFRKTMMNSSDVVRPDTSSRLFAIRVSGLEAYGSGRDAVKYTQPRTSARSPRRCGCIGIDGNRAVLSAESDEGSAACRTWSPHVFEHRGEHWFFRGGHWDDD